MDKTEILLKQIRDIKIQGATQVAKTSLRLVDNYVFKGKPKNKRQVTAKIDQLKKIILNLRPTEPLVSNFYYFLQQSIKATELEDINKLAIFIRSKIEEILKFYEQQEKKIISRGVSLIKRGDYLFTHCHSSLVEQTLIEAKKKGKKFKVFNSETRPLFQGRITARNLTKHNIDLTLVVDSAAPFLISNHSGDEVKISKLILGADVIGLDGTAINKIGSFGLALTAWESRIPVYVAASLLKIDPKSRIKITLPLEKRRAKEIWPEIPPKIKAQNYAFDYIPAKYITAYITEFGLITPNKIRNKVKKEYPCIFY